jgi:hypothetical protein
VYTKTTLILMVLALFAAPATSRAAVIVDQSSGETGQFIGSQDFPDVPAYSASVFDDFTISTAFNLTWLTVFGLGTGNPSANVAVMAGIYASPDLTTALILSTIGAQIGADLLFDFGGTTLAAGTYWVAPMSFAPTLRAGGSGTSACRSVARRPCGTTRAAALA